MRRQQIAACTTSDQFRPLRGGLFLHIDPDVGHGIGSSMYDWLLLTSWQHGRQ